MHSPHPAALTLDKSLWLMVRSRHKAPSQFQKFHAVMNFVGTLVKHLYL